MIMASRPTSTSDGVGIVTTVALFTALHSRPCFKSILPEKYDHTFDYYHNRRSHRLGGGGTAVVGWYGVLSSRKEDYRQTPLAYVE